MSLKLATIACFENHRIIRNCQEDLRKFLLLDMFMMIFIYNMGIIYNKISFFLNFSHRGIFYKESTRM